MWLWAIFSRKAIPIQRKPLIFAWVEAHILEWPRNWVWPWNLKKFTCKWKSRAWEVTWKKRCRIPPDETRGIHVWSFELNWVKISNDIYVLKFLLFIENFQIFSNFYPLSIVLDHFLLIWWCRRLFWASFRPLFWPVHADFRYGV